MYKITVGNKTSEININGNGVEVDGQRVHLDLSQLSEYRYHLLYNNKSYLLEVVSRDSRSGNFIIKVNNKEVNVMLKTTLDELLAKMGLNNNHNAVSKGIDAPMPGLILDIAVNQGSEVKKGEKLMVLEAMKMENIIKSPGDGKVKAVLVKKGDSVDSGQKLLHFE